MLSPWFNLWVFALGLGGGGCGLLLSTDTEGNVARSEENIAASGIVNGDAPSSLSESGVEQCANGARDADESDVDCGGSCAPCALGQSCRGEEDCFSGWCSGAGTCATPDYAERTEQTVAYYDFARIDGTALFGGAAFPNGTLMPNTPVIDGPFGAGDAALSIPSELAGAAMGYAWVPHSEAWNLNEGAIDLWIRPPAPGEPGFDVPSAEKPVWGLVSRDSNDMPDPNHFTFGIVRSQSPTESASGWLFVRQQLKRDSFEQQARDLSFASCSTGQVKAGEWQHVAVNFGGEAPELFIAGVRQLRVPCLYGPAATRALFPTDEDIGAALGISDNEEPFVFGHASISTARDSHEDSFTNLAWFDTRFSGGALAHIRISAARQDFTRSALFQR